LKFVKKADSILKEPDSKLPVYLQIIWLEGLSAGVNVELYIIPIKV
jgi:hypothetical protein